MPNILSNSLRCATDNSNGLPLHLAPSGPKANILNVALRLFAARGFAGTSIRDISNEVGLQPASLYSHYKGKKEILSTLINIGHEEHLRQMESAVSKAGDLATPQLRAYVIAHTRFHGELSLLATVINLELHALPDEMVATALQLRTQSIGIVMEVIVRGQQNGEFRFTQDYRLACSAICATGMAISQWYSKEDGHNLDNIANANADFACQMLGAASGDEA
jgi:AcrR family transcriptional regulator